MISLPKDKYLILTILLVLLISLSNFWIYRIYEYNFFIGELLVIETVLLFLSTISKQGKLIPILILFVLSILGSILLIKHFEQDIFSVSVVDSIRIEERRNYYAEGFGRIYKNRIGMFYFDHLRLYIDKISNNFFSASDLSSYFSHAFPIDQEKYTVIFAPLFIIGLLYLLSAIKIIHIIYVLIALSINTFISLDSSLKPLTIFPLISLCIATGLIKSLKITKEKLLR